MKQDWKDLLKDKFLDEITPEIAIKTPSDIKYLRLHECLIVGIEKKGRAGKTLTIISGFEEVEAELKDLAKELKNSCGVGGSTEDGKILIQGDQRNKLVEILKNKGYNVKKSGG